MVRSPIYYIGDNIFHFVLQPGARHGDRFWYLMGGPRFGVNELPDQVL